MRFIENVFVSDNIKDLNTVVYSLKRNIPVFDIYVVCVDNNGKCEIILSKDFLGNFGQSEKKTVIGLAFGKKSAYNLFADIVCYANEKGWNIDELGKNILEE